MKTLLKVPLRADLAGGWLDVPRFAMPDAYIVNCAISPLVSLDHWPYEKNSGLGGSAAWALLNSKDPFKSESNAGVGWQDPAIIQVTGLCVWKSGPEPKLEYQCDGEMLRGKMAIYYTGKQHVTADLINLKRNYANIRSASILSKDAVLENNFDKLVVSVWMSYGVQLDEGMDRILFNRPSIAHKYLGSGHGGYALHIFRNQKQRDECAGRGMIPVEPYFNKASLTP